MLYSVGLKCRKGVFEAVKVTERVRKFVDEYEARGFLNIGKAAEAAGYAPSGAMGNGKKILKECKWAREEVERRKKLADERRRQRASADFDELIQNLTSITRSNFCDFFDNVVDEDGNKTFRPRPFDLLTDEQQRLIKTVDKNGFPVLHDKMDAIRTLSAILTTTSGMNTDDGGGVVVLPEVAVKVVSDGGGDDA